MTGWRYRVGQVYDAVTAHVTDDDRSQALDVLPQTLHPLFLRMAVRDQRHSLKVLRRLRAKEHRVDSILAQAALMHDVGKAEVPLGIPGRSLLVLGNATGTIAALIRLPLVGGRIARYRRHPEIGARMLAGAGADPVLVEIVREHQAETPQIPETLRLQAADGRE